MSRCCATGMLGPTSSARWQSKLAASAASAVPWLLNVLISLAILVTERLGMLLPRGKVRHSSITSATRSCASKSSIILHASRSRRASYVLRRDINRIIRVV